MKIEKSNFPLVFLNEWISFRKKLEQIVLDNEEIIKLIEDDNSIKLVDLQTSEKFYFVLKNPTYKNRPGVVNQGLKSRLDFERCPNSNISIEPHKFNIEIEKIPDLINRWIELLKAYSNTFLTKEEERLHKYQEQYFHEFEIVDDDSYENPFELKRQLLLYAYLKTLATYLENKKADYDVDEIIKETNALTNNIQNYSKKKVIKNLSKLFAKMQAKNLELIKEQALKALVSILRMTYEAGIKALIDKAFEL